MTTRVIATELSDQSKPNPAAVVAGHHGASAVDGIGRQGVECCRHEHSHSEWCWSLGRDEAPPNPLAPLSALIPLVGGLLTWVDPDDATTVDGWTWWALRRKDGRGWYAVRWETAGGRRRSIYLHRQLLAAPPGTDVVHINGDGLDNRRTNLQLCTRSQSAANRLTRSSQTGYRGVYRDGRSFRAQITIGGKIRSLGQFPTADTAAVEYDRAAVEAFGSFARLNFPGVRP